MGGDVIASQTGAGNANGAAGTGGAANANGGTATSGPATVSNTATVAQIVLADDEGVGQRRVGLGLALKKKWFGW